MHFFQVKTNPAALLALSWYWASDGIGSKVCSIRALDYKALLYYITVFLSAHYKSQDYFMF